MHKEGPREWIILAPYIYMQRVLLVPSVRIFLAEGKEDPSTK